jgi:hypothetical protein
MHKECAEYSLQACPHINRAKGRYNVAAPMPQEDGLRIVEGAIDSAHKAEWFALMHTFSFTFGRTPDGMTMIKAELPWVEVQRWRDGVPI